VTPTELSALRPEVVVVKPCGFGVQRTLAERDLIERTIVAAASPSTRVYVADGNAFFNRPGPRLVESLEIMAACVHPATFADFAAAHAGVIVPLTRPA
jgi:iron complex transport system substrate-binding protein